MLDVQAWYDFKRLTGDFRIHCDLTVARAFLYNFLSVCGGEVRERDCAIASCQLALSFSSSHKCKKASQKTVLNLATLWPHFE